MHELNVMLQVLGEVTNIAQENHLNHVTGIVLEIGELSSVLPHFLEEYFPLMIEDRPLFDDCKLIIERVEGIGECLQCGCRYNVVKANGRCPECGYEYKKILQGRDFVIKEIQIPDVGYVDEKAGRTHG